MTEATTSFQEDAYGYFEWTPYYLSTFILSILFGLITLCGGAWQIQMRYAPVAKAAGAKKRLTTVWIVWLLTILFYSLTASWAAASAHLWALRSVAWTALIPGVWGNELALMALLNISTAGWMLIILIQARILRNKLAPLQGRIRPSTMTFFPILGLLGCLAIFGGLVLPACLHSFDVELGIFIIFKMVAAALALLASCLLLYFAVIIRKATHLHSQSDPLKKVLFIAVPLWVIFGLQRIVFAALEFALVEVPVPFFLSLVLFGLSSLATILVLPGTIVGAQGEKPDA
ncbi:hypothetical protein DL96DRAFT_1818284 [Flagelloscypha sp. PMI_526]|nr:hypothetical protein DL96DRAFT_1818284 [Flagelloscypha sp. PMI_526]